MSEDREKQARTYYQDLVYHACNMLDGLLGGTTLCGTLETPERANFKERCDEVTALTKDIIREAREDNARSVWPRFPMVAINAHDEAS